MVERILVMNNQEAEIRAAHLAGILHPREKSEPTEYAEFEGLSLEEATARLERHLIQRALEQANFVQSRAAEVLGTTRRILKYKMDQLGIESRDDDAQARVAG
jgi:transcriptional regulator with GAF, ATPase, and Fis domain